MGCDVDYGADRIVHLFQSTHPSGVRPGVPQLAAPRQDFNPRTPVGCDVAFVGERPVVVISIHAPQWGATARMGIAFHNMEAPPVLKTDFIAKIHVHRSIHKFSNQKQITPEILRKLVEGLR